VKGEEKKKKPKRSSGDRKDSGSPASIRVQSRSVLGTISKGTDESKGEGFKPPNASREVSMFCLSETLKGEEGAI